MSRKMRDDEPDEKATATQWSADLLSSGEDLEATVVVVMMEAARSAREDLTAIMAGIKAVNAAKRQLRDLLAKLNRDVVAAVVAEAEGRALELSPLGLGEYEHVEMAVPDVEAPGGVRFAVVSLVDGVVRSRHELEAAKELVQGKLDSLSEIGEMESLRLQMAMDRHSKMVSTLSNIMKKISDTSQSITQNIK